VAVLAPASPAAGRAQEVADWLAQRGFVPRLYPSAYAGTGDPSKMTTWPPAMRSG